MDDTCFDRYSFVISFTTFVSTTVSTKILISGLRYATKKFSVQKLKERTSFEKDVSSVEWCYHAFDGVDNKCLDDTIPCAISSLPRAIFVRQELHESFTVDKFGVNAGSVICGNIVCYRKQKYDKMARTDGAEPIQTREFGGDMTIEEFRANSLRDEGVSKHVETSAHVERLIPFTSAIEEASITMAGAKKPG